MKTTRLAFFFLVAAATASVSFAKDPRAVVPAPVKSPVVIEVVKTETKAGAEPLEVLETAKADPLFHKMKEIDRILRESMISKVELTDASLGEAFHFLSRETKVRFIRVPSPFLPETPDTLNPPQITLSLRDISAERVLEYLTQQSGSQYEIAPDAVLVSPGIIVCGYSPPKIYHISPEAIARIIKKAGFEGESTPALLQKSFEKLGVSFFPGLRVQYSPAEGKLFVQISENSIDLLEAIMDEACGRLEEARKPFAERVRERQFREVLEKRRALSQARIRSVQVHNATLRQVVKEIEKEKLAYVQVVAQSDGSPLRSPSPGDREPGNASPGVPLNFSLKDVSLLEFLQELARQTGTELITGTHSLILVPPQPSM